MLGPGQLAAKPRAADLEVVALVDRVGFIKQRVDCAGDRLTGVGVERGVAVDQDAEKPVGALLLKTDVLQLQAHAFDHRAHNRFDRGGRAAGVLCSFCHSILPFGGRGRHALPPITKRKRTARPTFHKTHHRTVRI